ncbi:hypothetical protein A3A14_03040 [Candidatus Daviesbacteria bacterium RIFCSPLOWO2_01_FULL_43_38]|uniref:SpoVT-AbrB domain-containing protein n=1 Tax=Candidatus Daviesbacteria bacterium RIFCSPHIGHO2_12_FULL_43_11 TaxID=1797780 RepID=A0A1F5K315_9BACT|nr:MAG: hypothetical protein A2874_03625 [Candidatus Daviesbacteria bacterium RIFCSPHIGHO2_01_FULL_43_17]OGE35259.1 MAG: hypothetical protein A3E45_03760 [Candidatus Daviesbacteria bacterium RIFCSPHIGHO2_12_FULL_43_11]OGE63605.1 MAG: hypothetical protein A3A14_03040 [Candidatus Daviesbacteria bacterium RIFCSPLOWO2_01_FULL_43_38]OGE69224.1 MAG: hypothetical protein A3J21_01725 [Candidatus Daviesbacteria bacterium RIFCSPLOWO2_02_FULL_43_11]
MSYMATITSKKQLTLPAELFRKVGFRVGQKVIVSEENGQLMLSSAEKLVEELAGSVPVPRKWKGKGIGSIINQAKDEYFKEKYKRA